MLLLRFSSYYIIFIKRFHLPKTTKGREHEDVQKHGAYDTLISLQNKLTCLHGVITPESVDKLEDELGEIFMVTKTHHYEQCQKYGHLASAILELKYRLIIGDATWAHDVPANPGTYSQAALTADNVAA
jgi:hypothetical protein